MTEDISTDYENVSGQFYFLPFECVPFECGHSEFYALNRSLCSQ